MPRLGDESAADHARQEVKDGASAEHDGKCVVGHLGVCNGGNEIPHEVNVCVFQDAAWEILSLHDAASPPHGCVGSTVLIHPVEPICLWVRCNQNAVEFGEGSLAQHLAQFDNAGGVFILFFFNLRQDLFDHRLFIHASFFILGFDAPGRQPGGQSAQVCPASDHSISDCSQFFGKVCGVDIADFDEFLDKLAVDHHTTVVYVGVHVDDAPLKL